MKRFSKYLLLISLILGATLQLRADDVIRILAIGNSFSEDATEQYLYPICESQGRQVIIGNLFIPACTVDTHCLNATADLPAYSYRKIVKGQHTVREKTTMQEALLDEPWDYISFQQASSLSGIFSSLSKLDLLLTTVRKTVGHRPVFCWQMTWAYAPASTHSGFNAYGSNQLRMYHDITETSRKVMDIFPAISLLIPTGTAIQNARTAISVGIDLTRDGYHLNLTVGRYIASLTWFAAIFRSQLPESIYRPATVSPEIAAVCHQAVRAALLFFLFNY